MRVILTQNVPKLGVVGDVCDVAPGYGRNFLLPQGMAVAATSGALKQIHDLKRTEDKRQEAAREGMRGLAGQIEKLDLTFTAKVGQTGRLYGSITSADIADSLAEALGQEVDRRKIILDESIRSLGPHEVAIHLMPGVDAKVKLTVVADSEILEDIATDTSAESDETRLEPEVDAADAADAADPPDAPESDHSEDAAEAG